jgi:hypothetical protein
MSLDPAAVKVANERLWAAHPELKRRALTSAPSDYAYRKEWQQHYQAASQKKPPPPPVTPRPVAPRGPSGMGQGPAGGSGGSTGGPTVRASASVVVCSAPLTVTDCKDMKNHLQEGDIVLRSTPGDDSDLIRKAGHCDYSHAGIVTKNSAGNLVVVDAYPRAGSAVAEESVDSFFCNHGAMKGLAARPKDPAVAQKAAQWAQSQTKVGGYQFQLLDPWNQDPKRLYCSDFVHQSFQNAGLELVPTKLDLMSPANKKNTIDALRDFKGGTAKFAGDSAIEQEIRKSAPSFEYITPCQVAMNAHTTTAVVFDPKAKGAGGGGGSKW